MNFRVHLAEYKACGRCGYTWPNGKKQSQLMVTAHDLARGITENHISQILGSEDLGKSSRGIMLLNSNLLRIQAVVQQGENHSLYGHSIMKTHHGSARINLSEDFGIAMAMSFLSKTHSCREHYNLDAVDNKQSFGIPSKTRPDIGSITPGGDHMLTEVKGRKRHFRLAPRPDKANPAKLVRSCYTQLTGGGQTTFAPGTRLFLCVTSPIDAECAMDLAVAEYVKSPLEECQECSGGNSPEYDDFGVPRSSLLEADWNAIRTSWYQRFWSLIGDIEAEVDDSREYSVLELPDAGVSIGLHRSISELVSVPESNLGRRLPELLNNLPQDLQGTDDGRYPDGTLIRANWPEIESSERVAEENVQ